MSSSSKLYSAGSDESDVKEEELEEESDVESDSDVADSNETTEACLGFGLAPLSFLEEERGAALRFLEEERNFVFVVDVFCFFRAFRVPAFSPVCSKNTGWPSASTNTGLTLLP